jgi:hypothetical protein
MRGRPVRGAAPRGLDSEHALRAAYAAHGAKLYRFALRQLGDDGAAQDVVQEVFRDGLGRDHGPSRCPSAAGTPARDRDPRGGGAGHARSAAPSTGCPPSPAAPPAPVSTPPIGTRMSYARMAPAVKAEVWVSAKNAAGSASISLSEKPSPVSVPSAMAPVVNGPCRQPSLGIAPLPSASVCGNASRGGPAAPSAASCTWVAVRAGLCEGGVTPSRAIS